MDTIVICVVAISVFLMGWLVVRREAGGLALATICGGLLFSGVIILAGLIMAVVTSRADTELSLIVGMRAVGTSYALFLPIALLISFVGGVLARFTPRPSRSK
ncbi:MAG: hypothetical protein WD118_11930 [Phycisphaeraceae bacterium]